MTNKEEEEFGKMLEREIEEKERKLFGLRLNNLLLSLDIESAQ
ncbi:MAG TPA: hypothetical protein VFD35_02470 [Pricia sp.]|nr:hypothetical protein [Pricia sp.]